MVTFSHLSGKRETYPYNFTSENVPTSYLLRHLQLLQVLNRNKMSSLEQTFLLLMPYLFSKKFRVVSQVSALMSKPRKMKIIWLTTKVDFKLE